MTNPTVPTEIGTALTVTNQPILNWGEVVIATALFVLVGIAIITTIDWWQRRKD